MLYLFSTEFWGIAGALAGIVAVGVMLYQWWASHQTKIRCKIEAAITAPVSPGLGPDWRNRAVLRITATVFNDSKFPVYLKSVGIGRALPKGQVAWTEDHGVQVLFLDSKEQTYCINARDRSKPLIFDAVAPIGVQGRREVGSEAWESEKASWRKMVGHLCKPDSVVTVELADGKEIVYPAAKVVSQDHHETTCPDMLEIVFQAYDQRPTERT